MVSREQESGTNYAYYTTSVKVRMYTCVPCNPHTPCIYVTVVSPRKPHTYNVYSKLVEVINPNDTFP